MRDAFFVLWRSTRSYFGSLCSPDLSRQVWPSDGFASLLANLSHLVGYRYLLFTFLAFELCRLTAPVVSVWGVVSVDAIKKKKVPVFTAGTHRRDREVTAVHQV